jgi:glycosyltransferase involved in cell wall biosynthesis
VSPRGSPRHGTYTRGVPSPTIALIVPVHQDNTALRRCLASIAAMDPPPDQVIVVDGGDPGVSRLARQVADKVLEVASHRGPAHARNRGAEVASADVLFFVDGDVELRPDAVEIVRRYLAARTGVAAIIGSYDGVRARGARSAGTRTC